VAPSSITRAASRTSSACGSRRRHAGSASAAACSSTSRLPHGRAGRVAHIETSAALTEALALYRSAGWVDVEPFNDEPFADHWLEKELAGPLA
jgi:hypothetical protein